MTHNQMLSFTNAQIINYFVIKNMVDGMPANDMKVIDSSALNLFRCGHIQDIKVCPDQHLAIQANCVPEMRKDCICYVYTWIQCHSISSVLGVGVLLGRVHMQAVNM